MGLLRKLASQTAVYGVSSIAARLLNYLLTPYLTRILTREEYGVITDMYALIPFALVVLTMGLETGFFKFPSAFRSIWGATCIAAAAFFGIVMAFTEPVAGVMGYGGSPEYVWLVAGIVALDVVTAIPFAGLRQQGRASRYVVVRTASVVVNVAMNVVFYSVLGKHGPVWVFVANLVASAVALSMVFPRELPRVDWRMLRPVLLYSLPLLVGGIAGTANEFIDRQMIKYLMPAEESMAALGVYGAVVKIGVVLLLFTQMYRMAAEPFFLAGFAKEDFVKTNAEAMKYFVIVSIGIFLVNIFALLVGRDFREGLYILPVVLVANILSGVVLNLSFWYKQYGATRFAILVTGTGLTFTVVFNILLVPLFGYFGSALARLICEIAMVVLSYFLNRRYCPTPYPLWRIGEYVLLGAALYGAGFATMKLPLVPRYLCNAALIGIFVVYAWRCRGQRPMSTVGTSRQ